MKELAFLISVRWHLPTLPPVTAVPSAVRGLTALFDKEEVFTRLKSTNLIDSFDHLTGQCLYSFSLQRETITTFINQLLISTYVSIVRQILYTLPGSLVRLGSTHLCASTCRLSTSSSTTPLYTGTLIFRPVSHLDAFSAYLIPT